MKIINVAIFKGKHTYELLYEHMVGCRWLTVHSKSGLIARGLSVTANMFDNMVKKAIKSGFEPIEEKEITDALNQYRKIFNDAFISIEDRAEKLYVVAPDMLENFFNNRIIYNLAIFESLNMKDTYDFFCKTNEGIRVWKVCLQLRGVFKFSTPYDDFDLCISGYSKYNRLLNEEEMMKIIEIYDNCAFLTGKENEEWYPTKKELVEFILSEKENSL